MTAFDKLYPMMPSWMEPKPQTTLFNRLYPLMPAGMGQEPKRLYPTNQQSPLGDYWNYLGNLKKNNNAQSPLTYQGQLSAFSPQGDGQVMPPAPDKNGKVDGITPMAPTYGTTADTIEADKMRQQVMGGGGGGGGAPANGAVMAPPGAATNLFNFSGLLQNPNIMTRLGAGYELGGLMGALGLAFTDMNPNSSANQQQNTDASEWNRYRMMQNNPRI